MCRQGVHYIFASIDLVSGRIRLHNSFGIRRPGPDSSEQILQEWERTQELIENLQSWAQDVQQVRGLAVTPFEVELISSRTQFDSTSCALHIFGNIIAEATGCTTSLRLGLMTSPPPPPPRLSLTVPALVALVPLRLCSRCSRGQVAAPSQ